jgi:hypothetical protein
LTIQQRRQALSLTGQPDTIRTTSFWWPIQSLGRVLPQSANAHEATIAPSGFLDWLGRFTGMAVHTRPCVVTVDTL